MIRRRSSSDDRNEYGDPIPTEETAETVGELQQRGRSEPSAQGELSVTDWLLVLPPGTGIGTGDAVEVDGDLYEVVGDPWPARNPRTGAESHVEATVRRAA